MALYRATAKGNIPMTPKEEAEIKAEWASSEANPPTAVKSLEQRVSDLETAVSLLSK